MVADKQITDFDICLQVKAQAPAFIIRPYYCTRQGNLLQTTIPS